MSKSLSNISQISIVSQNGFDNLSSFTNIGFEVSPIGSGGFGTVYRVTSIDEIASNKYVIKIFDDEKNQEHAYKVIELLHSKVKSRQINSNEIIFQDFPQLLGLPFMVFKAVDLQLQKEVVAFLMLDLSKLGYFDFGGDDLNAKSLRKLPFKERFHYAFQLSKVISFLHGIQFIHADISENAIWINPIKGQLALIDYDSGFHYDKQEKPSTLGKLGQWTGKLFRNLLKTKKSSEKSSNLSTSSHLKLEERLQEEYWLLANAIFELIIGVIPYFFLADADDITKTKYVEKNQWPLIDYSSPLFNPNNQNGYETVMQLLKVLEDNGFATIIMTFKEVFGKGYSNEKKRKTSEEWKKLLFSICLQLEESYPVINYFLSNKKEIKSNKEKVKFDFDGCRYNNIYINDTLISYGTSSISLSFPDTTDVNLRLINDFGETKETISINAIKVTPRILEFNSDKKIRESLDPIILNWNVEDASHVIISSLSREFLTEGTVGVEPVDLTIYTLKAIGHFNEVVSEDITLDVVSPNILEFNWVVNLHKGLNNVDISWKTDNTQKVILSPLIGEREANGLEHVSINGEIQFKLIAKGLFKETEKELIAEPFGFPKIRQLITPMPNFQITNVIETKSLKIPTSLLVLPKINFTNKIIVNRPSLSKEEFSKSLKEIEFVKENRLLETMPISKNIISGIKDKINCWISTYTKNNKK